jgi:Uma2 family endonuclease
MASPAKAAQSLTLDDFLKMPEIDEHPYLEYHSGRIEAKMSPQGKHSRIETKLAARLDAFGEERGLGGAFVELRCTFAGRSLVPDIVFLREEHIETDLTGEILELTLRPPDIHMEVISPTRSASKCREKLAFSIANGCPLGWLIDPSRKMVHVYRPGRPPQPLAANGFLDGEPVLPGYRLPVTELFGWLKRPKPAPPASPSQTGSSAPEDST